MEPELSELVLQLLSARTAGEDESEKTVIGISTIMTWARTSPPVVEEGEEPLKLTEDEYKRRRPHVNFADQHTLEKLVVKSASSTVRTHVVCAGLVYGGAEELFHPLFKLAWHNQPVPLLALAGGGANVLPTIHVRDLSSIVLKVAEGGAPKFIVAVDAAREQTLLKITQAVAKQLGTGELAMPERDEVLLEPSLDYLQLHLPIEPTSVLEMGFEWVSQAGLARNMAKMVGEFRAARRVEPLKLLLAGTLAGVNGCLESQLAAAIAAEYRVERVTTAALVAAALGTQSELSDKVRAAKAADKQNTGNLPDELMVALVRAKLNSAECSNQGYVLDGFPQTLPQLRLLAPEKVDGEEEEEAAADDEEGEADVPKPGVDCTPEHVLVVRSADDQLKQRVQAMAQPQVEATGMTADQLLKRMQFWVQANAPEGPNNLLMHKAVKQLEPLELDADALPLDAMLKRVRIALGKPRNYGPTEAEVAAKEARLVALKAEEEAKAMTLAADRLKVRTPRRATTTPASRGLRDRRGSSPPPPLVVSCARASRSWCRRRRRSASACASRRLRARRTACSTRRRSLR